MKSLSKSLNSIQNNHLEEQRNHDIRYKQTQRHWDLIEKTIQDLKVYKEAIRILEYNYLGIDLWIYHKYIGGI